MADGAGAGGHMVRLLRLKGRTGAPTGNEVLAGLLAALAPGMTLVMDLAEVEAIEAAGAEVLAAGRRQAMALGGDVQLSGAQEAPVLPAMPHRAGAGGGMA